MSTPHEARRVRSRPVLVAFALGVGGVLCSGSALAHQPPPRYSLRRPLLEVTTWIGLGGGAVVGPGAAPSIFDLRLGGDFTAPVGAREELRLGPFVEVSSGSFASFQALGGVELFVGASPRPLRMFLYSGEGVFLMRLGAGWTARSADHPGASSTPVAAFTVAYGYRAPFSLREPESQSSEVPDRRGAARYMTGARLWASVSVDLADQPSWQLTGGLEFEPVGSFRYLLGLY